jgi:hypothetical protein
MNDLTDAIGTSTPPARPHKTAWLQARAAESEAAAARAAKVAAEAEEGVANSERARLAVSLQPGSGLLELAKRVPVTEVALRRSLQSAGYLLQAVVLQAGRAQHMAEDCQLFSAVAEHVEQLIAKSPAIGGSSAATSSTAAVEELSLALEEGVAALALFSKTTVPAAAMAKYDATTFMKLAGRMRGCALDLGCEPSQVFDRAGFAQSALLNRGAGSGGGDGDGDNDGDGVALPTRRDGEQASVVEELRAELNGQQHKAADSEQQQALLARQNQMLMDQCSQMAVLMEKQDMMMKDFMGKFPHRAEEAETVTLMDERALSSLDASHPALAPLHAMVDELAKSGSLGPHLVGVCVTFVLEDFQFIMSSTGRSSEPGRKWISLGHDATPRLCKWLTKLPRKNTACQYTVGKDGHHIMQCGMGPGTEFGTLMQASQDLIGVDKGLTSAFTTPIEGGDGQHSLFDYMLDPSLLGTLEPIEQEYITALFSATMSTESVYSGMPVRIQGRPIGAFCCTYDKLPGKVPDENLRAIQQAKADEVSTFFSELKVPK